MFPLWADSAWLLRIGSTSFEIAPERPPDGSCSAVTAVSLPFWMVTETWTGP